MDHAGTLDDESKDRANLAMELFHKNNIELILTIGWAYRNDCDYRICDVVKEYILKSSEINSNKIKVLPHYRDNLGMLF